MQSKILSVVIIIALIMTAYSSISLGKGLFTASVSIQSSGAIITYSPLPSNIAVNLYPSSSYDSLETDEVLADLASGVPGINNVDIDVWVTSSGNTVNPTTSGISAKTHVINQLKASGYTVTLRMRHASQNTFTPSDASIWFVNYATAARYWASYAENLGVDFFIIGTEFTALEKTSNINYWNNVISSVRAVFSGEVSYETNYWYYRTGTDNSMAQKKAQTWFSNLDFITVSAYWKVATNNSPTVSQLVNNWRNYVGGSMLGDDLKEDHLHELSLYFNKPLWLAIGICSADGACMTPYAFGTAYDSVGVDLQEQADYYEAFFRVFNGTSWVTGYIFDGSWMTDADLKDSINQKNFSVQGKPAQDIIADYTSYP